MAKRSIYIASGLPERVEELEVDFEWYSGFAVSQKQKSISSLHESGLKLKPELKILEISSKSTSELGVRLSAFNLTVVTKSGKKIAVENIFQGSKVFSNGGPYKDLYTCTPLEAKRDKRLKDSGNLMYFEYKGEKWPLVPTTIFYDWIYMNALSKNPSVVEQLLDYNAFTDIEFNPNKSLNCQAKSVALYINLYKSQILCDALKSKDSFIECMESVSNISSSQGNAQGSFL